MGGRRLCCVLAVVRVVAQIRVRVVRDRAVVRLAELGEQRRAPRHDGRVDARGAEPEHELLRVARAHRRRAAHEAERERRAAGAARDRAARAHELARGREHKRVGAAGVEQNRRARGEPARVGGRAGRVVEAAEDRAGEAAVDEGPRKLHEAERAARLGQREGREGRADRVPVALGAPRCDVGREELLERDCRDVVVDAEAREHQRRAGRGPRLLGARPRAPGVDARGRRGLGQSEAAIARAEPRAAARERRLVRLERGPAAARDRVGAGGVDRERARVRGGCRDSGGQEREEIGRPRA